MTLPTNHASGDTITAADVNAIAVQVNTNTTDVAARASKASNLADLASVAAARTNLGLGSAAVAAATDFDAAGTATAAVAAEATLRTNADAGLIAKSLIDAKGDLLVGTADNTVARKAAAADGAVLVTDSTQSDGLRWQARPTARVYQNSGPQSIPNNTTTPVTFDAESYDAAGMHDTVTNNTRVVVPTAGKYRIMGLVPYQAVAAGGSRHARLQKNGATNLAISIVSAVSGEPAWVPIATEVQLAANDYIELCALQTAGIAVLLNTPADYATWMTVTWVAP